MVQHGVPVPQFPHLQGGRCPRRGGGCRGEPAYSDTAATPRRGLPRLPPAAPGSLLLAASHNPSAGGWARTRRAGASLPLGGGGGKNGAKLGDLGISLLFFAVMPGTTTPSPLSPQRSSSSGLSANAFIRLHDAITRSSQKM